MGSVCSLPWKPSMTCVRLSFRSSAPSVVGIMPSSFEACTMNWRCLRLPTTRSEEHTSELQSQSNLVCRLLLEKKKTAHLRGALNAKNLIFLSNAVAIYRNTVKLMSEMVELQMRHLREEEVITVAVITTRSDCR